MRVWSKYCIRAGYSDLGIGPDIGGPYGPYKQVHTRSFDVEKSGSHKPSLREHHYTIATLRTCWTLDTHIDVSVPRSA